MAPFISDTAPHSLTTPTSVVNLYRLTLPADPPKGQRRQPIGPSYNVAPTHVMPEQLGQHPYSTKERAWLEADPEAAREGDAAIRW